MANAVVDLTEYRASHGPQTVGGQVGVGAQAQTTTPGWFAVTVSQIPTWGWVAAGLVAVGILAARWKQK